MIEETLSPIQDIVAYAHRRYGTDYAIALSAAIKLLCAQRDDAALAAHGYLGLQGIKMFQADLQALNK